MAKVPFSKFQAKMDGGVTKLSYHNLAGEDIYYEVKHYLPLAEKLDLVSRIINQSIDDNGFYNPMRVKLYMALETIYAYTNLSFTEKMKEDPFKLYDILVSTGILTNIINVIRESDWAEIQDNVWSTIKNIYDYKNSVMGILDNIKADYGELDFDASTIQQKLADPENMTLLREVLAKLG
jgi:hypothetical protein